MTPPADPQPQARGTPALLLAGFDAGQTHTSCRLAVLEGGGAWQVVAEGEGSGVSHLAAPEGEARFSAALHSSLAAARAALPAALLRQPLAAAAVGASGIETGSPVQRRGQELAAAALALAPGRVVVTGDEQTALQGAFPQGAGILLISGTGCIGLGRDGLGRTRRCGGWGWLLDGAGSAMDIGRDGLAASVRMADGRLPDSPLRAALWRALGAPNAQAVKAAVVAADFGAAGFARLAPVVDRLAGAGDREALTAVERSAAALVELAATLAEALELEAPPICPQGGAIEHLAVLRRRFREQLAIRLPAAQLAEPAGDACSGALALAAQLAQGQAGAGPFQPWP